MAADAAAPLPSSPDPKKVSTTRDSGPIRPEPKNVPAAVSKSNRRQPPRKKTARVSAATPTLDPRDQVTAAAASGELTDELRDKLLACVCMPRPVFMADLIHLVGDADLVEQWEKECRAQGSDSPIRFIAAKQRHKARGHLVIPFDDALRSSTTGFEKSLWNQFISHPGLRGAKLYELAVLLHRVIDQVVTADIGDDLVTFRVNQQRGLVGVIVTLTVDLQAGTPARAELGAALSALSAGRLGLMAVCTYAGGPRSVPEVADAVRELIGEQDLAMPCPVIAQASWEFADDGGTTAVSVTGG